MQIESYKILQMKVTLEIIKSHSQVEATHEICSAYSTCIIPMVSHDTGYDVIIPSDFEISTVNTVVDYVVNMAAKERKDRIKFIVEDSENNDKWKISISRFVKRKTLRDLIQEQDAKL